MADDREIRTSTPPPVQWGVRIVRGASAFVVWFAAATVIAVASVIHFALSWQARLSCPVDAQGRDGRLISEGWGDPNWCEYGAGSLGNVEMGRHDLLQPWWSAIVTVVVIFVTVYAAARLTHEVGRETRPPGR